MIVPITIILSIGALGISIYVYLMVLNMCAEMQENIKRTRQTMIQNIDTINEEQRDIKLSIEQLHSQEKGTRRDIGNLKKQLKNRNVTIDYIRNQIAEIEEAIDK